MAYGIKRDASPECKVIDLVKSMSAMAGPVYCGHEELDLLAALIFDARSCLVAKNFVAVLDALNVALDTISEMQIKFEKEGKI